MFLSLAYVLLCYVPLLQSIDMTLVSIYFGVDLNFYKLNVYALLKNLIIGKGVILLAGYVSGYINCYERA